MAKFLTRQRRRPCNGSKHLSYSTQALRTTKHQYDYDVETVTGFLRNYGLADDFKINIEVNHATLAGHTYQHELQMAADAGLLGSMDANRGDYQNGWDTDQFPNNINEVTEAMLVFLEAGGLKTGGINFDAKIRRNSTDPADLFYAHIGGMDTFARALLIASEILEKSDYRKYRKERYASFDLERKELKKANCPKGRPAGDCCSDGEPSNQWQQEWLEHLISLYI